MLRLARPAVDCIGVASTMVPRLTLSDPSMPRLWSLAASKEWVDVVLLAGTRIEAEGTESGEVDELEVAEVTGRPLFWSL